jgi:hypothetical protein
MKRNLSCVQWRIAAYKKATGCGGIGYLSFSFASGWLIPAPCLATGPRD